MAMLGLTPVELSAIISVNVKNRTPKKGVSLTELRNSILFEFEENDRRRGVPYLTVTKPVSMEYKLEYKSRVEFAEGEEPFHGFDGSLNDLFSAFSDDTEGDEEEFSAVEEVYSSDESEVEEFDDEETDDYDESEDDYDEDDDDYEDEDEEDYEEEIVEEPEEEEFDDYEEDDEDEDEEESGEVVSPSAFLQTQVQQQQPVAEPVEVVQETEKVIKKQPDKVVPEAVKVAPPKEVKVVKRRKPKSTKPVVKKPVKKVVKKQPEVKAKTATTVDAFEDLVSGVSTTPKRRPPQRRVSAESKPVEAAPRTLRELIRANPGCDVAFASKYFPRKEIQKQERMGRIFIKNGKLTI